MSLEQGITRIGHVIGNVAGICLGLFGGIIVVILAKIDFKVHGTSGFENFCMIIVAAVSLLTAAVIGFVIGYGFGYFLISRFAQTINWIIEGFREK